MVKKYSRLSPTLNSVHIGSPRKAALRHVMADKSMNLQEAVCHVLDFYFEKNRATKTPKNKGKKKA